MMTVCGDDSSGGNASASCPLMNWVYHTSLSGQQCVRVGFGYPADPAEVMRSQSKKADRYWSEASAGANP